MPQGPGEVSPLIKEYWTAYVAALDFCRPHWELYARLYEFFRNKRFDALQATYSKINIAYAYAAVADRLPKIYQNVFSTPDHVSLQARNPEAQLSADAATSWVRHLLTNDIKIEQNIIPTLLSTLIGGTAYRMPYVAMKKDAKGSWSPRIFSRDVEFFHVLPCPGAAGHVNPLDKEQTNAVPWVLWIDWESENAIKAKAERGFYNRDEVGKLLAKPGQQMYLEDPYRNRFAVVGNLTYAGPAAWRARTDTIEDDSHRRRVVHWFRRDKHIIVAEDRFVLHEGPPVFEDGTIPLAKYTISQDLNNWFGISYLGLMEDLLKAQIMNMNYRHDRMLAAMFPTTWIRQDIAEYARNKGSDLRPKPYDVRFFPDSVQNIQQSVWYDRFPELGGDAFVEEDRMKAAQQKVGGQTETTASLNDVVGNKTATGVTSIMGELAARPNMESLTFEMGFREEVQLLLGLGARFITEPTAIGSPRSGDGFNWRTVTPDQIAQEYNVQTHGTRWMAERNTNFQKLMALYPYFSQRQNWDGYELDKFAAKSIGMPDDIIEKALVQINPMLPAAPETEEPDEMGGMASAQDMGQSTRSVANRTGPTPANVR